MSLLPFAFASKIEGLSAFTSLRGHNLGLNTSEDSKAVVQQRRAIWAEAKLPLESAIFMRQVHADKIIEVGKAEAGRGSLNLDDAIDSCDGMISAEAGVYLCVGHADCLAIILVDPIKRVVGVAHSGWRGAALGISSKLGRMMIQNYGCKPSDLLAGLSVCLGPCHLKLSQEQYEIFSKQAGFEKFCSPLKDGHFYLDLREQARGQLLSLGLSESRIETQDQCTACYPEKFYSYRAESGDCGRMMSVVGFK